MSDILGRVKACRRVSVPLVAYATSDQNATIAMLADGINGETPKIAWDFCNGVVPLNQDGQDAIASAGIDPSDTAANPAGTLQAAVKLPKGTMLFMKNAQRFLDDVGFIQGCCNLRDAFKKDRRMLILMGPAFTLPLELRGDVVVIDEPLPDVEQSGAIISRLHEDAGIKCKDSGKAVAAVQGMPAFQIEQEAALSLTKKGIDVDALWEAKRKQISQTKGLSVFRETFSFDRLGGLSAVKADIKAEMGGRVRHNAVVWLDEIEKQLAGKDDLTGVTADFIGVLLEYLENRKQDGYILIGHPGTGKSAIAKSAGTEGEIPTVHFDLGAMMGSLVGESQAGIRTALKTVEAISSGQALWVVTCNAIGSLPPELQSRFSLGTYFFDLPTADEREAIWSIYVGQYGLDGSREFDDSGWTGREIERCCRLAWRRNWSLEQASAKIVPTAVSNRKAVEDRQTAADGRYLDASREGLYRRKLTRDTVSRSVSV